MFSFLNVEPVPYIISHVLGDELLLYGIILRSGCESPYTHLWDVPTDVILGEGLRCNINDLSINLGEVS